MKAQLSLTPAEAKRLIAKAVRKHPQVERALQEGIIAVAMGATNAYVLEELLGRGIEKERYVAGFIDGEGACVVPGEARLQGRVLERGVEREAEMGEAVRRMGPNDVFIKGANALDAQGVVGVMLASETGGTIGAVLGTIKARGVRLILPVGLEKLIPGSVGDASRLAGIYGMDYSAGVPVGLMPVHGEVVTEVEAFQLLTGAKAVPIGSGGMGSGAGARTFVVMGSEEEVKKAIALVEGIKGERGVEPIRGDCGRCVYTNCPRSGRRR